MISFLKELVWSVFALVLSIVLFYLSAISGYLLIGNSAPAPFFNIAANRIEFSNPVIQGMNILFALISPVLVSVLMYLCNGKRMTASAYTPLIFLYPGYVLFILAIYFTS